MAVVQNKWGKWIEDAIAANPRLSKTGLSRHLQHGLDRSRVLKMISGYRNIFVDEIEDIAAYLDVPPPLISGQRSVIPVIGVIGEGRPSSVAVVPAAPDRRHSLETQRGYALAGPSAALNLIAGDVLITIPLGERPSITHGDMIVTEHPRSKTVRYGLACAEHYSGGIRYASVIGDAHGQAIARAIGVYRPLA